MISDYYCFQLCIGRIQDSHVCFDDVNSCFVVLKYFNFNHQRVAILFNLLMSILISLTCPESVLSVGRALNVVIVIEEVEELLMHFITTKSNKKNLQNHIERMLAWQGIHLDKILTQGKIYRLDNEWCYFLWPLDGG